jgi:adenosylhomocysteine nucleosidase
MKLVVIALEAELPQELPQGYYKVVTGVGKVNAAIVACQRIGIMPRSITEIINYGTAGIVSKKPLIGQLVQPDVIIQRDMMAEPQAPRGVVPFEQSDTAGPIMLNTNTNITLGTGDSFVMKPDPWFEYASIDLVDMEAYALAKAANRYNIPFKCYKYVSDFADENAADTWQENVDKGADLFTAIL